MAAGSACKLRMYDETSLQFRTHPKSPAYVMLAKSIKLFELVYSGTANAAKTEISAPSNVLDGEATPVLLSVISNSVQDGAAGTGILTARIIGVGQLAVSGTTYGLTYEDVTMNGTTRVHTTKKFKQVFHIYGLTWGSTKKSVGTIVLANTAGSTVYLTIGAAANESDGSAIFFPTGYTCILDEIEIDLTAVTNIGNEAHVLIDIINCDGNGASPDFPTIDKKADHYGGILKQKLDKYVFDADALGAKITFSEIFKTGAEAFEVRILLFIIEKEGDY